MTNGFRANIQVRTRGDLLLKRAELRPEQPVRIDWYMGRKVPEDVIWAATAPIVSGKFIALLQENGFTGWTTYPVEVFDKAGTRVEDYSGLAVTGRCGPVDRSKSMSVLERYPARTVPKLKGYFFDPETWDGTDLFMPSAEFDARIFITVAVRDVLRRAKVKNIRMPALDEVVYRYPLGEEPGERSR
jgi:hypothetical protein